MTAQLQPLDLVAPGFRGLNLSQANTLLDPSFATVLQNAVIDDAGRVAARNGYTDTTTVNIAGSPAIKSLFQYVQQDGDLATILAWNGGISNNVADPVTGDISGAVTDTDGAWFFQNFNNKCIGLQSGLKPIVYTGAGNFAAVVESSGTAPTGGVGLCAYGRVWCLDADKKTIKYSGLLDETDWGSADAGIIDTSTLWTAGTDEVTALAAFNGMLVIFGRNHVIFYIDGTGSALGIDPLQMYVTDVISGTGCVSQQTLQQVGETDLLFLGPNGLQSLARLTLGRSNPITNLSKYVRDQLLVDLAANGTTTLRSTYNPKFGFYLLSFPTAGKTYVFDQRYRFQDPQGDEVAVSSTWTLAPTALVSLRDHSMLIGGTYGVGTYGGSDDAGEAFRFIYQSPWLDLGEEIANRLKIMKRMGSIIFAQRDTSIVYKWYADFSDDARTATVAVTATSASEWAEAEWGEDEWGGGLALNIIKVPARITGQYFRIGIEAEVNGTFAIQQAEIFAKIGRYA